MNDDERLTGLILLAMALLVGVVYLLWQEKKNIPVEERPLTGLNGDPVILPQHLQDFYRRVEDGEEDDIPIDDLLDDMT